MNSVPRTTTNSRRWAWLIVGVGLLSGGTWCAVLLKSNLAGMNLVENEFLASLIFSARVALYLAPPFVLAILATLSWRPIWQRVLIHGPAFLAVMAPVAIHQCVESGGDVDGVAMGAEWLWALLGCSMPVLTLRIWRRWTIVPHESHAARPATIATLLTVTTLCAAAIGGQLSGMTQSELAQSRRTPGALLLDNGFVLLLPTMVIGIVLAACVCAVLGKSRIKRWLSVAIAAGFSVVVIPTGLAWWYSNFKIFTFPSFQEVVVFGIQMAIVACSIALIGLLSFLWLLSLGYVLVAKGHTGDGMRT